MTQLQRCQRVSVEADIQKLEGSEKSLLGSDEEEGQREPEEHRKVVDQMPTSDSAW